MRPHLGLRARLVLVIVLVIAGAATATAVAAYRLQADSVEERFTAAALTGFRSDVDQARLQQGRHEGQDLLAETALYMRGRHGIGWVLFDFRGGRTAPPVDGGYPVAGAAARSGNAAAPVGPMARVAHLPADLVRRARLGEVAVEEVATDTAPVLALSAPLGSGIVLVELYDLAAVRYELSVLERNLVLIALAVAAVGVVAALLAAHAVQRPVRRAASAANRLGRGELDVRLPVRGRDELADLARSFNAMASRLGESIEDLTAKDRQQRRFIADVTHDLRTPVAAMVAVVDRLDDAAPATRARAARLLGTQSRRLAKLVEDLLEVSRFDAGAVELQVEPVDLRALLADAVAVTGTPAALRSAGDTVVTADPRRLHAVACNLLANAAQHGAPPVTVTVDGTGPAEVRVQVADSGPGVPAELAPTLFDRFTRADRSRAVTGGSGLGLAIARENASAHGGSLEAHNDGGAVFTLVVPR